MRGAIDVTQRSVPGPIGASSRPSSAGGRSDPDLLDPGPLAEQYRKERRDLIEKTTNAKIELGKVFYERPFGPNHAEREDRARTTKQRLAEDLAGLFTKQENLVEARIERLNLRRKKLENDAKKLENELRAARQKGTPSTGFNPLSAAIEVDITVARSDISSIGAVIDKLRRILSDIYRDRESSSHLRNHRSRRRYGSGTPCTIS